MSNIFDKFNKIWVNYNEIDLANLEINKGKYHIDNYQTGDGNINVKFQLKENENLTPGIFDGNEQIKNITLSEDFNIEIEDGSFAGLTKLSPTSKQTISNKIGGKVFEPTQEEPTTPEEPAEQFYFSIGQEEVTEDNYTTVNNAHKVSEYPSEVQEFTPEAGNENVYILVKNDKTIVVTQPNIESTVINTLVEEININDEYKVVHYNKITGTINIQIS
ncbi:hypothetical protein IKN40_08090 [bacterium]|nr:hypothetical protein [bacterium]